MRERARAHDCVAPFVTAKVLHVVHTIFCVLARPKYVYPSDSVSNMSTWSASSEEHAQTVFLASWGRPCTEKVAPTGLRAPRHTHDTLQPS